MKKVTVYFILILIFTIVSCENESDFLLKQENSPKQNSDFYIATTEEKNEALNQFGWLLAKSISKSTELREIIKKEASYMFNFEYDVLYLTLKEKKINGKLFNEFLAENSDGKYNSKQINELANKLHYLQISIPVNFNSWTPVNQIPYVAIVPVDIDEKTTTELKIYNSNGTTGKISAKEAPNETVLIISEAERIDRDGKLLVNNEGFILPKNQRINISTALENAHNKNKSLDVSRNVIHIYNNSEEREKLEKKYNLNKYKNIINKNVLDINKDYLKSATLKASGEQVPLYGSSSDNAISLYWNSVYGANIYKIYGTGYFNVNGVKTFIGNKLIKTTSLLNYGFLADYANQEYTFSVYGYYNSTMKGYTKPLLIHSTARKNNGEEYIDKMVFDDDFVRSIEGWYASDLELYPVIKYVNANGEFNEEEGNYAKIDVPFYIWGNIDFAWDDYYPLFNWDRASGDFGSYTTAWFEYDGDDDDEQTLTLVFDMVKFAITYISGIPVLAEVISPITDYIIQELRNDYCGAYKIKWWDPNEIYKSPAPGFEVYIKHNPDNN